MYDGGDDAISRIVSCVCDDLKIFLRDSTSCIIDVTLDDESKVAVHVLC